MANTGIFSGVCLRTFEYNSTRKSLLCIDEISVFSCTGAFSKTKAFNVEAMIRNSQFLKM